MSALIVTETYGGVSEKGVKLQAAQMARKFALGNWTTVRIGVRGWAPNSGGAPSSGSVYFFGLNSGTVNLPGDASCSHFVGMRTVTAVSGAKTLSWFYGSNVNKTGIAPGGFRIISKLVGTTYTDLVGSNFNYPEIAYGPGNTNAAHRSFIHYIDYTRVSGTQMTIRNWAMNGGASAATRWDIYNPTRDQFLQGMDAADPSLLTWNGATLWHNVPSEGTQQITNAAVNESTNGTLDTVVVGWDRSTPYFVINDIAVMRLA